MKRIFFPIVALIATPFVAFADGCGIECSPQCPRNCPSPEDIIASIKDAQTSISIVTDKPVQHSVVNALVEAKKNNSALDVSVVEKKAQGSTDKLLQDNGIKVRLFNAPSAIIDGKPVDASK